MEIQNHGSSPLGCPYTREANTFCHVLVNELAQAETWAAISDTITAIQRVRGQAKNLAAEWQHLHNPSPLSSNANASDQATASTKL